MNKVCENAQEFFSQIIKENDNSTCFECNADNPAWASVNNGIFICYQCSGLHRSFGVNFSFVRSLTMDNWTYLQLQMMVCGGNRTLQNYFKENKIDADSFISLDQKFKIKECEKYREKLREKAETILNKNKMRIQLEINGNETNSEEENDLESFLKKIMQKNEQKWIEISHTLKYVEEEMKKNSPKIISSKSNSYFN